MGKRNRALPCIILTLVPYRAACDRFALETLLREAVARGAIADRALVSATRYHTRRAILLEIGRLLLFT
jgi:hypothetical protein